MITAESHIDSTAGLITTALMETTADASAPSSRASHRRIIAATGAGLGAGLLMAFVVLLYSPEIRDVGYAVSGSLDPVYTRPLTEMETEARRAELSAGRLRKKMAALLPRSAYLVVSTSDNRFELYGRGGLTREGVCSTGSYVLLRGGNDEEWMFQTPRGMFRIQQKRVNPVWSKPDWAFVEEGLPIPPPGAPERYERGVLGKYALAIGNGYLIHGTLYQRMLGQPVTHGCIRLGDDDLEAVYRELAHGARVFIY